MTLNVEQAIRGCSEKEQKTLLQSDGAGDDEILRRLDLHGLRTHSNDFLLNWITRLSPLKAVVLSLGLLALSFLPPGVAAVEGNFFNPGLKPDAAHDLGWWNQYALFLPTLLFTMAVYFSALPKTLLQLSAKGVVDVTIEDYNSFIASANTIFKHKVLVILPWVVGVVAGIGGYYFFAFHSQEPTWFSPSGLSVAGWLIWPFSFLLYYVVASFVGRVVATFLVLRKFFRLNARVQPLHPDGCGGLSPLGRLSMRLNFATFMFGIIAGLGVLTNVRIYGLSLFHPTNIAIVGGYVIGAGIAFFLPLFAAYRSMKLAKEATLLLVHRRFEGINRLILEDMSDAREINPQLIQDMENVHKVYEYAKQMPVYPFNIGIVSSFLGSVVAPLGMLALEQGVSQFLPF